MKIPRFLKTVMAFLVCIAFIRTVNDAPELRLDQILLQIQSFELNFDGINQIIDMFTEKSYLANVKPWNESLTGIGGFFENAFNLLFNGVKIIVNTTVTLATSIFTILKDAIQTFANIFNIILYVCGYQL